jgi:glycosyltransferase involved in cell wall biosynthesis
MTQPLVSVVIPFYNSASYLEQSIQSVLKQTYDNWELILANNCSTDNSLKICETFAAQDSRIKIISSDHFVPQVPNYNRALTFISKKSKYCKIVQADDWIFPRCIEAMVNIAETNPSVALVGAYAQLENQVYLTGLSYKRSVFSGDEVCRKHLLDRIYVFGTPNSILMRSDIVRSRRPFYDEESPFEDAEVCFEILRRHDFGFCNQVLTFIRRDNDSIYKRIAPFNPRILFELRAIIKFGEFYLSPEEFQRQKKGAEWRYYRYLGESILRRSSNEFWEFHKNGLRTINLKIDNIRVFAGALVVAIDWILNPKSTIEQILKLRKANIKTQPGEAGTKQA